MTALLIAIPPAPETVSGMEQTLMRGWMGGSINWNMFLDVIYQLHYYSNYLEKYLVTVPLLSVFFIIALSISSMVFVDFPRRRA